MNQKLEIEITNDGSATIYLPEMDEHYHSIKGALTESEHIFRDCALLHSGKKNLRVLEIGFGTGLNAFVSAQVKDIEIEYFTLEKFPLSLDIIKSTKLGDNDTTLFNALHEAEWNKAVKINDTFILNKIECDFTDCAVKLPTGIDVVYFDAFAPEKQPEMWSEECFQRIYDTMNSNGILTTYCAKGEVRRRLQSIGFKVERIAGPIGGKREILRAIKI